MPRELSPVVSAGARPGSHLAQRQLMRDVQLKHMLSVSVHSYGDRDDVALLCGRRVVISVTIRLLFQNRKRVSRFLTKLFTKKVLPNLHNLTLQ